jgi:dGTPase
VHAGHLVLGTLADAAEQQGLAALATDRYAPDADQADLVEALRRLLALPQWPVGFDGGQRALASLKGTTSQLIGRFCQAAETATRSRYGPGPWVRYEADLVVPARVRLECAMLKAVTAQYVMGRADAVTHYAQQRELVQELCALMLQRAPETLEPSYREQFEQAGDDAGRLRAVVDQLASLTDPAALAWHARLTTAV